MSTCFVHLLPKTLNNYRRNHCRHWQILWTPLLKIIRLNTSARLSVFFLIKKAHVLEEGREIESAGEGERRKLVEREEKILIFN